MFATVHTNEANSLSVMSDLVQEKFGIVRRKNQGRCLLAQAAYAAWAQTKIPVSRFVTHVDDFISNTSTRKISDTGVSFDEIMLALEYPIYLGKGKTVRFPLELNKITSLLNSITLLQAGVPLIFIIDADTCAALLNEATMYGDGTVKDTTIRKTITGKYHSLLAIGVDYSGYVIFRESRHDYGFKGYARIGSHILEAGWEALDVFCFGTKK